MGHFGSRGRPETTSGAATNDSSTGAVAARIGGEGSASGDGTRTTGGAKLDLVDHGPFTVVSGSAGVSSTATSPRGADTFVHADTYGSVAGADLILTFSTDISGSNHDGTSQTATSTTHLFAVDIDDFEFADGPRIYELGLSGEIPGYSSPASGNQSAASADVDAEGDSTFTLALTDTETTGESSSVAVDAYGLIA